MRRAVFLVLAAALLACLPASAQAPRPASRPVVVELFTAQGCAACPAANAWAARLAGSSGALVLTYPVDYWDYLGWKDTLARPAFAMRQRGYRTKLGLKDVYTPQLVVEGRWQTAGNQPASATRLMRRIPFAGPRVTLDRSRRRVVVEGGPVPPGGAEAWLVRYDPRMITVRPAEGETKGMAVPHRNTVRELVRLGTWTGRARSFDLPPTRSPGLRNAVLVQSLRGHGVLGAAHD